MIRNRPGERFSKKQSQRERRWARKQAADTYFALFDLKKIFIKRVKWLPF